MTKNARADEALQRRFRDEFIKVAPHWERSSTGRERVIVNPTPLIDVTREVLECARTVYGVELSAREFRVLGKLESAMPGGSIKTRAALSIISDAINSGRHRSGQVVFEATSGNFGIALGLLGRLGFTVVALVSRELRPGVLEELKKTGVKLVDLDIEICPAPGLIPKGDDARMNTAEEEADPASSHVGRSEPVDATLLGIRQQLSMAGLDPNIFDRSTKDAEGLLVRQDAIGLAKLLAKVYGGFCPEQYDNELNVKAHESLTGPEIDQQLRDYFGSTLEDFELVTAFGTGGTSSGLLRYLRTTYGGGSVHVVFPKEGQDVAGIRTKSKASGLKFYAPSEYEGQHEVDFEQGKKTLDHFVRRGYDIGESSALALFAVMQVAESSGGGRYVVILADGIGKYVTNVDRGGSPAETNLEVEAHGAISGAREYAGVVWAHPVFLLSSEGKKLITSYLGVDPSMVSIADSGEVEQLYFGDGDVLPPGIARLAKEADGKKLLLVCTTGSTSHRLARLLTARGIRTESLAGGIAEVSKRTVAENGSAIPMSELLETPTSQPANH